jgi:hypothetical protein
LATSPLYFTSQVVKHVDSTQLQRVGAIPEIHIRSTLTGIRAGVLARGRDPVVTVWPAPRGDTKNCVRLRPLAARWSGAPVGDSRGEECGLIAL